MTNLQKSTDLAKKIINITKAMGFLVKSEYLGADIEMIDSEIAGLDYLRSIKDKLEAEHIVLMNSIKK